MAGFDQIKWSRTAFRQIRTLPSVRREIERRAEAIADDAGEGFKAESGVTGGRGRARTAVFPTTLEASRNNSQNNALLRALGRNRG